MTSPAQAALLRLIANASDQQTCDDLALVVHACEQAKGALQEAEEALAFFAGMKTTKASRATLPLMSARTALEALES